MGTYQKYVRRYFPDEVLYTVSEAAAEVGKSVDTLRRWRKAGVGPSKEVKLGKNTMGLYTVEDIQRLRAYGETVKLGRPPKEKVDG